MTISRGVGKGRGVKNNTTTLKLAKLDKVIQRTNELNGITITAGFDKSSGNHPITSVPYYKIATWMEYGTANGSKSMQKRPFMEWTFKSEIHRAEIKTQLERIVVKAFTGSPIKAELNSLGKILTKAIQDTMAYMSKAFPNQQSWAEVKGHDNSFFWTGGMFDSVMFKIKQ